MRFRDRVSAGQQLAKQLAPLQASAAETVVLGLPRGGVPVAREVATALDAPLDVLCVRKLGLPGHPEFGMGAIGEGGVRVLDDDVIARAGISSDTIEAVERPERAELARRAQRYRGDRPPISLRDRTAVIVDDGVATGGTARAAIQVARAMGARKVIVAVPVAPADTVAELQREADDVVVLLVPPRFHAVGEWYDDFTQTSDAEVLAALSPTGRGAGSPTNARTPSGRSSRTVQIPLGSETLEGLLEIPDDAHGIVVFAHGSGSSRHSVRNRAVARRLHEAGMATFLFDLLTEREAHDRSLVFDTELLAERLHRVTAWVRSDDQLRDLPLGLFGASTGAGAALRVAAVPDSGVRAVVSRGGRPDLAGDRLSAVRCPTLLIVGGADTPTLQVNEAAATQLRCPHQIAIIRGATHLFEEQGALETVARLAAEWFNASLPSAEGARPTETATAP
jgi:Predicted phosphoribosyltransferases